MAGIYTSCIHSLRQSKCTVRSIVQLYLLIDRYSLYEEKNTDTSDSYLELCLG